MSSIQERLQLKRVPLDTWNTREQLCLASAVVRSGDQNWMSVSRALKTIGEPNRPPDWYSQKSCAAQYGALLEHVETPKRKKRSSSGGVETPQESILKKLTQERILEIQRTLAEMNQQYQQYANELAEVRNSLTSEERLKELWDNLEAAKRAKERENARRAAWLKEREDKRARAERTWRPPNHADNAAGGSPVSAPVSSPLLTSLLKSSPVVTTPQHITHPANVVETISPSAGAPTLSMLLEKNSTTSPSAHDNKHAAIEHIKNQLVQLENQLKASSTPPPIAPPPVDIDDIEIKAEDVYVFRDIDLHIPPGGNLHRVLDKPQLKKNEESTPNVETEQPVELPREEIKIEPAVEENVTEEPVVMPEDEETPPEEPQIPQEIPPPPQQEEEINELEAVQIAFPEVKFPTPEIKIITSDEQKVKEEVKESDSLTPEPEKMDVDVEEINEPQEETQPQTERESTPEQIQDELNPVETIPEIQQVAVEDIPLPEIPEEKIPEPAPPEPEPEPPQNQEIKQEVEEVAEVEPTEVKEEIKEEQEKEEVEEQPPQIEQPTSETVESISETKDEGLETEDTHTETDDDTPMELVREEDKEGKKRKDYSRKKKPDSRTCSGSESATEASAPESPSGSEAERQHRLWKKSVMLVYSRLCAHKYASLFLRPITDEEAPGYSMVVKRPMDLVTIRRNIESGAIRTTAEFQRDILLMLTNALMYNSSEHSVYMMTKDFLDEAATQLSMLVAAQAHAGLVLAPARRQRKQGAAGGRGEPARH